MVWLRANIYWVQNYCQASQGFLENWKQKAKECRPLVRMRSRRLVLILCCICLHLIYSNNTINKYLHSLSTSVKELICRALRFITGIPRNYYQGIIFRLILILLGLAAASVQIPLWFARKAIQDLRVSKFRIAPPILVISTLTIRLLWIFEFLWNDQKAAFQFGLQTYLRAAPLTIPFLMAIPAMWTRIDFRGIQENT